MKRKTGVKKARPKNAQEWIEVAKKKAGIESDGKMSRAIGTTKQAVSNYKKGRNAIGAKEAIKLGWLIDEDPVQIIIESSVAAYGEQSDWANLLEEYRKRTTVQEPEEQEEEDQQAKKREPEPKT